MGRTNNYQLQEILNDVYDDTNGVLKTGLTVENIDLDVEGSVANDAADSGNPVKVGGYAVSAQPTAMTAADRAHFITDLYNGLILAGYNYSNQKIGTEETDPLSSHHVEETLAAVTDGADDTYYYYVDMDGYQKFASQFTLSGGSGTVTVTLEATIQDDGTAPASCTYIDVTNDLFGVASTTASDTWVCDTPVAFKYLRYKVVASTGDADDADWTIYHKKQY